MATTTAERAEPPLVLALDVGTSSVRALLFDRLGRAIEGVEASRSHRIEVGVDGAAEVDADRLLERLFGCIDGLLQRAGTMAEQIQGVAACTLVGNIMGVDERGKAVTPLITYADTRAAEEAQRLRAELDEAAVHARTGCRFHSSYLPAQFRWLARAQPERLRRSRHWISIGGYLFLKLFGEAPSSLSVASWTGLLDRHRLVWDAPLLAALPLDPERLPPLTDVDRPLSGLRESFARRWPALAAVPWFPAIGDGAAANLGSGCLSPERVALTIGTTTALRAVVPGPAEGLPLGLWCYRVDGEHALPGGALTEGGNLYAWMRESLRLGEPAEIEAALTTRAADSHGLTVLPFLAGERSPGWAGHARATIHGITLATTPLDLLQAGLESVAYRIARVFDLLAAALPGDPVLIASGGAVLNSPAWLQIITDVLGRPVSISTVSEASSRGSALLALRGIGALPTLAAAPAFVGRSYEPDRARHERYRAAMVRQQALYEKLV